MALFRRAIGSGYLHLSLAASTGAGTVGSWVQIPPVIANKIQATATFAGTTGTMKLYGKLSSSSTAATLLVTRTQAQRSAVVASTIATAVNFLRVGSTKLTGGAGTMHVVFVP